jgi:hypothetical protein
MSDDEDTPERECRCCRKPVPNGVLACFEHWTMLPRQIREDIRREYKAKSWREYAAHVRLADTFWRERGIWKAGVAKPV